MKKHKRGQFSINTLVMAGIMIMILSLVLTISTGILQDEYDEDVAADVTNTSNATRTVEPGIAGLMKFAKKQPTIAGAIIAVSVIGIILAVIGGLKLGK